MDCIRVELDLGTSDHQINFALQTRLCRLLTRYNKQNLLKMSVTAFNGVLISQSWFQNIWVVLSYFVADRDQFSVSSLQYAMCSDEIGALIRQSHMKDTSDGPHISKYCSSKGNIDTGCEEESYGDKGAAFA